MQNCYGELLQVQYDGWANLPVWKSSVTSHIVIVWMGYIYVFVYVLIHPRDGMEWREGFTDK